MTVTAYPARNEYTGTASQTVFNFTFKIYTNQDLDVYITPAGQDANDSADITTAYTIDPSGIYNANGGFLTLNTGVNAGDLVTIVSSMPSDRIVDYQNSGDFLPDTVNNDIDRAISLDKQSMDVAERTPGYQRSQQNVSTQSLDAPVAGGYWRDKPDRSGVEKVIFDTGTDPLDAARLGANNTFTGTNNFTSGISQNGIRTTPIICTGVYLDGSPAAGYEASERNVFSVIDNGTPGGTAYRNIIISLIDGFSGPGVSGASQFTAVSDAFGVPYHCGVPAANGANTLSINVSTTDLAAAPAFDDIVLSFSIVDAGL